MLDRRQGRRWRFGSAVLDEASWTLSVDGQRVAIEAKPLEVLHELLLRAGELVTKGDLLDAIWPDVSVVEASLPTAISKLRRVLKDDGGDVPMIETVPRIGYRLAVPVTIDPGLPVAPGHSVACVPDAVASTIRGHFLATRKLRWLAMGGLGVIAIAGAFAVPRALAPPVTPAPVTRDEAIEALRALDMPRLRSLLARGWKPGAPLTTNGDKAIGIALEACEWNPGHDRRQLLLVVRMLLDHGALPEDRNRFGDTPYSIAKAPRYCGPDHPATRLLHAMCYSGSHPPGDRCLATYELARRGRSENGRAALNTGR